MELSLVQSAIKTAHPDVTGSTDEGATVYARAMELHDAGQPRQAEKLTRQAEALGYGPAATTPGMIALGQRGDRREATRCFERGVERAYEQRLEPANDELRIAERNLLGEEAMKESIALRAELLAGDGGRPSPVELSVFPYEGIGAYVGWQTVLAIAWSEVESLTVEGSDQVQRRVPLHGSLHVVRVPGPRRKRYGPATSSSQHGTEK